MDLFPYELWVFLLKECVDFSGAFKQIYPYLVVLRMKNDSCYIKSEANIHTTDLTLWFNIKAKEA